jgi:tRNA pseudouridine38-40 synthase
MRKAAAQLLGEHDFSSFRAAACQARHPRRRIMEFAVHANGPLVILDITANAFLQHMVRNLAGLLLVVGRGERPASWAGEVLAARDRTCSAPTAPPQGLCMVAVSYPQHFALPENSPRSMVL